MTKSKSPLAQKVQDKAWMTSSLKTPVLLDMAAADQARFFIQFSGQAGLYIDELKELYGQYPKVKVLVELASVILSQELNNPKALASGFYAQGLNILDWLDEDGVKPSADYLSSSVVSQPLIFITQVAHFYAMTEYSCDRSTLLKHTAGITGHSQGIMAAVLVALDLDDEAFKLKFQNMIQFMFWQGLSMEQSYLAASLHPSLIEECARNEWGKPTSMVSISGIDAEDLKQYLSSLNQNLLEVDHAYVSLINGYKRCIVSGHPKTLILLRRYFEKVLFKTKNDPTNDFSFDWQFLPVSLPFHTVHMTKGISLFELEQKRIGLELSSADLKVPVHATDDGRNLQHSKDLIADLIQMQYLVPVDWDACTKNATLDDGVTHILDFGPGDGASTLTYLNREGQGVAVIACATTVGRDQFLNTDESMVPAVTEPWQCLAPKLVKLGQNYELENRFTKFTGRAPIFGGGMTPTTAEADIVVAAANEGYIVEWAGGAQVTEEILRKRLDEIKTKLKPGQGIIFNALYLDAYLWNLQFPLLSKLKKEGYPIIGLTISAGVPSQEKASEILAALKASGIWCNSFKPGSDSQIKSVLDIAKDHPDTTFMIQIEGGKAGGHHSWEDLYGLLERNYARVRRCDNLVICAGGGVYNEKQAFELLSGTWHKSGKIMPIDGVILGTRLMASLEAKTAPQVKKLLAKIKGTERWIKRHEFFEGMTSGQSQLGADVHYADNKMARAADFVDQISEKSEKEIFKAKDELVALISDTCKPYFGDVDQMTYGEVLTRMVSFMAPGNMPSHIIHDGEFFDKTFRARVFDFSRAIVSRLSDESTDKTQDCIRLICDTVLDDPKSFVKDFIKHLPKAKTTVMHTEDVDVFFGLCRRPGKPVNFVPVIDKNIKRWFKGDSLWQSHDPRYTIDQTLVIPGPEAVKGILKVDEPVASILGSFKRFTVAELKKTQKEVNQIGFLGDESVFDADLIELCVDTEVNSDLSEVKIRVAQTAPGLQDHWINYIASFGSGALKTALTYPRLLVGGEIQNNFIPSLIFSKVGAHVVLEIKENKITSLSYFDGNDVPAFVIQCASSEGQAIKAYLYHRAPNGQEVRLDLNLNYQAEETAMPLSLCSKDLREQVRKMYVDLWLDGKAESKDASDIWQSFASKTVVTQKQISEFSAVVGDRPVHSDAMVASPSLAVVLLWKPLAECLLQSGLEINLLNLLHLSNAFEIPAGQQIRAGDELCCKASLVRFEQDETGKTIEVDGSLILNGQLVAKMKSQFLVQETLNSAFPVQETRLTQTKSIKPTELVLELLKRKEWFQSESELNLHSDLIFTVDVEDQVWSDGTRRYIAKGVVSQANAQVGVVGFESQDSILKINPVTYFLNEYALNDDKEVELNDGHQWSGHYQSPWSNEPYSLVSGDFNPIHVDARFGALAGLKNDLGQGKTIVHGMWSSAASLAALSKAFPEAVTYWKADFVGMVDKPQRCTIKATHVGNMNGERVYKVQTFNSQDELIMQAKARLEQKKTAYLFTGQGSQTKDMGMESYDNSPVAKRVWDQADEYTQKELGFSILTVVKDNPKEMLVYGDVIKHPKGVLHLTQFSQVSLTVLAMAQIEELKAAGVYQREAKIAGHSLGEYAALSCSGVLSLEAVVKTVYNRGLTMQNYVPRNQQGESPYAMMVVRPKVVAWDQLELERQVKTLTEASDDESIYVVNYNIEGSQYAVTGHLTLLQKLEAVAKKCEKELGVKKSACVWIDGVDVPFHSDILVAGVPDFRKTLNETIQGDFDMTFLEGRYIPNLNAKAYSLQKSYVQDVCNQTGSDVLFDVLKSWPKYEQNVQELGRLLLIELLAYQFASPVRWIGTQKLLITDPAISVERVIEIGPSPVLSNMMKATLMREKVILIPEVYQFESDRDDVFYNLYSEEVVDDEMVSESGPEVAVVVPATSVAVSTANMSIPDDKAFDVPFGLKALLAIKLGIRMDEIKDGDTIEALSGGNSAKRNELLSDIGAEFKLDAIDDGHTMPMSKLCETLADMSDYIKPGSLLTQNIDRALKEKLPLAKKDVLKYFKDERVLPAGLVLRALAFLPTAIRFGASRKSGDLSSVGIENRIGDAKAAMVWLSSFVDAYGSYEGVTIPHKSQLAAGGSGGASVSAEALNEFKDQYFGATSPFAKWAVDFMKLCGLESDDSAQQSFDDELSKLKLYEDAFGEKLERVIKPLFDVNKVVSHNSVWNWSRSEFSLAFWKSVRESSDLTPEETFRFKNQITPELKEMAKYFSVVAQQKGLKPLSKTLSSFVALPLDGFCEYKPTQGSFKPYVEITESGEVDYSEVPRAKVGNSAEFLEEILGQNKIAADDCYVDALKNIQKEGVSFKGKVALVTGASPSSIAWEVVKNLLQAGAKVVATTTSYHDERLKDYRELYQQFAGSTAELHVIPFSQGSKQDVDQLMAWCFKNQLIPDFVVPFGAVSELATLSMMNPGASTATLRVLLQGVQWIIGALANQHRSVFSLDNKTMVLLPLSPNHGVFGGDGAYGDAKIGLESLFNRWHGEHDDWGRYVSLTGANIGWVRGTGLMDANNLIAVAMEDEGGMRTFSTDEMGFLLTSLCHEKVLVESAKAPIKVDLTGGFSDVTDLSGMAKSARESIESKSQFKKKIQQMISDEKLALYGESSDVSAPQSKSKIAEVFPKTDDSIKASKKPVYDPAKTVVVVGYGEVSPFGSSKPRFEMECGDISVAGAIELAWIMGLIRYEDGTGKIKTAGWVDVESSKSVADVDIWNKYKDQIESNTGVRFTDPDIQGFDPKSAVVFGDVVLEQALVFAVDNKEQADQYLKEYGDSAVIKQDVNGDWKVELTKGSAIKVPRKVSLSRWVAGQIPKGWDATRFGVPKELIGQVDRVTLFNMVATAEAFTRAGIEPEQLYETFDRTRVANTQGGGMGGMQSFDKIYHDHRQDRQRQGDALQETLINVGPAWVTQSYIGNYGPMVHPVAACATSLVSLATGVEQILANKADFAVAGGYDDYSEEGVIGFSDMAATCDTEEMLAKGISPKGMSRSNDSRRGGFVEAQGGGTLLLSRLDKAIEAGLPVYAVLAHAGSFSDGVNTSIPAPGLGLMGMAHSSEDESTLGYSLKQFGLEADDITVVSKHDTSTNANDPNENQLHHVVQSSLGRTEGNPLYVHSQKAKLGHAKGGAGAWQSIACIQMLESGKIPGNQNLENVDPKMKQFSKLVFSDKTLNLGVGNIRGVVATSLGFGHVGAVSLFVRKEFALTHMDKATKKAYQEKLVERELFARQKFERVFAGKVHLYEQRTEKMTAEMERKTLLGEK